MTITSQQVDAWDAEVDAAYAAGRQEGIKQERALWTLTKLGQEIEAQPEQEPVMHLWECIGRWSAYLVTNGKQADCAPPSWLVESVKNATTPPKREWVDLTDEERASFEATLPKTQEEWDKLFNGIEAKLKEKNT